MFENLSSNEKVQMVTAFENTTQSIFDKGGFVKVPKRKWENAFGIWTNFFYDLKEFGDVMLPQGKTLANNARIASSAPLTKQERIECGLEAQQIE